MDWQIFFTKKAEKDSLKLARAGLKEKAEILLEFIQNNPYQNLPPYEKLMRDLKGVYSRRINIQHRLVYQVFNELRSIKVLSMWSHYE